MFAIGYQYRVPPESVEAYRDLQRRVAGLYREAGCARYLVMAPARPGDDWLEMAFYPDRAAHQRAEARLEASGALEGPFQEFLRITGLRESELRALELETAVDVGA